MYVILKCNNLRGYQRHACFIYLDHRWLGIYPLSIRFILAWPLHVFVSGPSFSMYGYNLEQTRFLGQLFSFGCRGVYSRVELPVLEHSSKMGVFVMKKYVFSILFVWFLFMLFLNNAPKPCICIFMFLSNFGNGKW